MNNNIISILGLMSGTSMDGIDLAFVTFEKNNFQNFEIVAAATIPYPFYWKKKLKEAIDFSEENLQKLSLEYGIYLGDEINHFIKKCNINSIDFIASHGHTILHQPEKGITLQIGDGQSIANKTQQKVVCNFRTQDVALGGQGAPLVPIGDELLFSEYDFCLNLGGFANISFKENGKRIAFDVCPVNVVLNFYANKLGFDFDAYGDIAASSMVDETLFHQLNAIDYYSKNYPKSLGIEWVNKEIFPILEASKATSETILRTFSDHIAYQISRIINEEKKVLCTGGGTYNQYIIQKIASFKSTKLIIPDKNLIDFKEALIFAFLGLLRNDRQINCLSSVTGAKNDHSSGEVFYPKL